MAFDPIKKLAYVANYNGQSISILQEPIIPSSITPPLVDTAMADLVIDFGEEVVTSTVQFNISPTVSFTVTWDMVQQRTTISHTPFQPGVHYTLSVLSSGLTVSNIPIADISFNYTYYPYRVFLTLMAKNH